MYDWWEDWVAVVARLVAWSAWQRRPRRYVCRCLHGSSQMTTEWTPTPDWYIDSGWDRLTGGHTHPTSTWTVDGSDWQVDTHTRLVHRQLMGQTIGAVQAMKPEATAIGDPQGGRWKIILMFDGRRFCIPKFGIVRYSRWRQSRHWWFPTTSCFGVTNHSEAASLWLVRQDRATINWGSPPSCGATFWQWSVASPSEMGWLASKVSRYLSILCLWVRLTGGHPHPTGT